DRGTEKISELCAAKPAELKYSADDFEIFEKMREFAKSLQGLSGLPASVANAATIADSGYEGFPVQQTSFSGGKATRKQEVQAIDRAGFSDADFSLGSAQKVDLGPQLPR